MHTLRIEAARERLPELIRAAATGAEIVIVADDGTAVDDFPGVSREQAMKFLEQTAEAQRDHR